MLCHQRSASLAHSFTPSQVLKLFPDLEGAGGDSGGAAAALAAALAPVAMAAYECTLSAAFTTSAEEKRRAKESLAQVALMFCCACFLPFCVCV